MKPSLTFLELVRYHYAHLNELPKRYCRTCSRETPHSIVEMHAGAQFHNCIVCRTLIEIPEDQDANDN